MSQDQLLRDLLRTVTAARQESLEFQARFLGEMESLAEGIREVRDYSMTAAEDWEWANCPYVGLGEDDLP